MYSIWVSTVSTGDWKHVYHQQMDSDELQHEREAIVIDKECLTTQISVPKSVLAS